MCALQEVAIIGCESKDDLEALVKKHIKTSSGPRGCCTCCPGAGKHILKEWKWIEGAGDAEAAIKCVLFFLSCIAIARGPHRSDRPGSCAQGCVGGGKVSPGLPRT